MAIGIAKFPGLNEIRSADFTFSGHGTTPSSCVIEVVPQATPPATVGTLRFQFGSTVIEWGKCLLDIASFSRNASGLVWKLRILDRRWQWREKTVTGSYNLRNQDETIDTTTEKTPHQLAKILLDALGEVGYDVTALPLAPRPMVQWEFASAAQELDSLCDMFGCRAVMGLNGRVKICVLGVGADLPDLPTTMDVSGSINPPEIPDILRVVFGPTRVQLVLTTEAVGLDTDKKTKPINDLTYKPAAGWGRADLGKFLGIANPAPTSAGRADESPRALALRTVFRWYRVDGVLGNTTIRFLKRLLGTYFDFKFDRMNQLLPLLSDLVEVDAVTKKNLEPFVQGTFALMDGRWGQSNDWQHYKRPFSLIADKGIVDFNDYVFKWTTAGAASAYLPADIYLTCSVNIKHHTSMAVHRIIRDKTTGAASGMGAKVLREEDVAGTVVVNYKANGEPDDTTTNISDINQEADYHLSAAMAEYQLKAAADQSYAGLVPIGCDGAIQQVTYTVQQGAGCTTRASRNNEYHLYRPNYKQRRDVRQVQANNIALLKASHRQANRQLRGY